METITAPTIDGIGIYRARMALGMTQVQFARALGDLAPNTIHRWERGAPIHTPGLVARAVHDLEVETAGIEELAELLEPVIADVLATEQRGQDCTVEMSERDYEWVASDLRR